MGLGLQEKFNLHFEIKKCYRKTGDECAVLDIYIKQGFEIIERRDRERLLRLTKLLVGKMYIKTNCEKFKYE